MGPSLPAAGGRAQALNASLSEFHDGLGWKSMPRKHAHVLLVSTPTIEACPITAYSGFVTTRIVMGTGFFKDLDASVRDIAGGRSGGYEAELDEATQRALDELREKAAKLGANCVLSVSVQIESISGKGNSMLAVAAEAQGPPCGAARACPSQLDFIDAWSMDASNGTVSLCDARRLSELRCVVERP